MVCSLRSHYCLRLQLSFNVSPTNSRSLSIKEATMLRTAAPALLLACVVAACQGGGRNEAPAPSVADAEAGVGKFWADYTAAAKAGDAAALAQLHTADAYIVEPGMPTLHGRDAVAGAFGEGFKAVKYSMINIRPELTEWHGSQVFQVGTYDDQFTLQGQERRSFGRYSGVFVRDSSGKWLVARAVVAMDSSSGPQ